jgi:hypothetical protein
MYSTPSKSRAVRMKRFDSVSFLAGSLAVGCYLAATVAAWSRYPLPYSPLRNWLSDLGNPLANPQGAMFYNGGLALTAGGVLLFFLGLTQFRLKENRRQTLMIALTAAFGSLGAFGMLMTTVFPINQAAAHSMWGKVNFIATGTGFAFSVAAFRYYARYPRWLLVLGVVVAGVNLGASVFYLESVFVSEWIVIALWLSYVPLLGLAVMRLSR